MGKEISIFVPLLTKFQVQSTTDSSVYQLGTVACPVTISLDEAAAFSSLCAEACTMNSSTGFHVLSPEFTRLLLCWPLCLDTSVPTEAALLQPGLQENVV